MRGYLRMAYRHKKSVTWQEIFKVLKCRVLTEKPTKEDVEDAAWTLARDRGGLLYITTDAKEFFVYLTAVVLACEKKDGSIDYEEVIRKVSDSPLTGMWDSMIGSSLHETISLNLMNDVICSYCRTCARGFAKRTLNFLKEKPMRHAVATRKK